MRVSVLMGSPLSRGHASRSTFDQRRRPRVDSSTTAKAPPPDGAEARRPIGVRFSGHTHHHHRCRRQDRTRASARYRVGAGLRLQLATQAQRAWSRNKDNRCTQGCAHPTPARPPTTSGPRPHTPYRPANSAPTARRPGTPISDTTHEFSRVCGVQTRCARTSRCVPSAYAGTTEPAEHGPKGPVEVSPLLRGRRLSTGSTALWPRRPLAKTSAARHNPAHRNPAHRNRGRPAQPAATEAAPAQPAAADALPRLLTAAGWVAGVTSRARNWPV